MSLYSTIKEILNINKKLNLNHLPSQNLFYKNDFEIFIKKADIEDIIEYEYQFKEDISLIINKIKKIVEKNTILTNGYNYEYIKSIDIIFIFLEIVKFTKNKPININYFNDKIGKNDSINFDSKNFNYTKIDNLIKDNYDKESKEFLIDGYKYSLPSIGIENSLTHFLLTRSNDVNIELYNKYSYDFLYFLGNKSFLTFSEIENLIQIFNYDITDDEKKIIKKIIKSLSHFGKYTLKKDESVIDINSKIDLEKIWKLSK